MIKFLKKILQINKSVTTDNNSGNIITGDYSQVTINTTNSIDNSSDSFKSPYQEIQGIKHILKQESNNRYFILLAPTHYGKTHLLETMLEYFDNHRKYTVEKIDLQQSDIDFDRILKNIVRSQKIFLAIDNLDMTTKDRCEELFKKHLSKMGAEKQKIVLATKKFDILKHLDIKQPIELVYLQTYNEDFIYEEIRQFLKTKNSDMLESDKENYLQKIFLYLVYHTSGCIGCFRDILKQLKSYDNLDNYFYKNHQIESMLQNYANSIAFHIDSSIQDTIISLSPIRKFDLNILDALLSQKIIHLNNQNIMELESNLTTSKWIKRENAFLQFNIIRDILALNFKNDDSKKYLASINIAIEIYYKQLTKNSNKPKHILALEIIFLTIEKNIINNSSMSEEGFKSLYHSTYQSLIDNSQNSEEIKELFLEAFNLDIQLQNLTNYYFNVTKSHFTNLYGNIYLELANV